MKNEEGYLSILFLFSIAVIFIAALWVLFEWQNERQFEKYSKETAQLRASMASTNSQIEFYKTEIELLKKETQEATNIAKRAENLSHKVAVDAARKPAVDQGLKLAPVKVIVYQAKDLQKSTKKVKESELDEKLVKDVKEKIKILSQ